MKTYSVYGSVIGTKFIGRFRANSKDEAIRLAEKEGDCHVSLCHQCDGECEDGEVRELIAEEVPD
ncbi:hypothetical protein [Bradyrhizobium sp. SZCCHNRI2010]|uniref:hypothetical protein n=1 Tax=Bradyrhizobium sp. SZCCHNRI2010 TaxID=3057283 RepID=UPI0028E5F58B|nr:hypothetical protein [Bradyrhizobium sp. SZCCHNRI2010]